MPLIKQGFLTLQLDYGGGCWAPSLSDVRADPSPEAEGSSPMLKNFLDTRLYTCNALEPKVYAD